MRNFIFSLLLVLPLFAAAQDSAYHHLFLRYQTGVGRCTRILGPSVAASMQQMTDISPDPMLGKAVSDYVDQRLVSDLVDFLEPAYRSGLSEADLRALLRFADKHPRLLPALEVESMPLVAFPPHQLDVDILSDLVDLLRTDVEPQPLPEGISPAYLRAFKRYWPESDLRRWTAQFYALVLSQFIQVRANADELGLESDVDPERLRALAEHPELFVDRLAGMRVLRYLYSEQLSLKDLKMLAAFHSLPQDSRAADVFDSVSEAPELNSFIMYRFFDWAEPLYPSTIQAVRMGFEWAMENPDSSDTDTESIL